MRRNIMQITQILVPGSSPPPGSGSRISGLKKFKIFRALDFAGEVRYSTGSVSGGTGRGL